LPRLNVFVVALAATASIDEHSWELDADSLEYFISKGYVARKDVEDLLAGEEDPSKVTHVGIDKRASIVPVVAGVLLKCKFPPKIPKCIIKSPKGKTILVAYNLARLACIAATSGACAAGK